MHEIKFDKFRWYMLLRGWRSSIDGEVVRFEKEKPSRRKMEVEVGKHPQHNYYFYHYQIIRRDKILDEYWYKPKDKEAGGTDLYKHIIESMFFADAVPRMLKFKIKNES